MAVGSAPALEAGANAAATGSGIPASPEAVLGRGWANGQVSTNDVRGAMGLRRGSDLGPETAEEKAATRERFMERFNNKQADDATSFASPLRRGRIQTRENRDFMTGMQNAKLRSSETVAATEAKGTVDAADRTGYWGNEQANTTGSLGVEREAVAQGGGANVAEIQGKTARDVAEIGLRTGKNTTTLRNADGSQRLVETATGDTVQPAFTAADAVRNMDTYTLESKNLKDGGWSIGDFKGNDKAAIEKLNKLWMDTGLPLSLAPHNGGKGLDFANEAELDALAASAHLPPGTPVVVGGQKGFYQPKQR